MEDGKQPLKISILDRTDTEEFEQLKELLKKFTIDTYIRNKPEFASLMGSKKFELVNNAIKEFESGTDLSVLSAEDIKKLKEDIESQIGLAEEFINGKESKNTETRYYVLKDGEKIVSFQQAQLSEGKNGRIEGWRNLAYTEQKYAGKSGEIIDSSGNLQNGIYSETIYEDISSWFEENGVNYERTCTGANMLSNIQAYIRAKGFFPLDKDGKVIYLGKDNNNKVDTKTGMKAFRLYRSHRDRQETRSKEDVIEEIESIPEFANLTKEQKAGLVKCFLKEEEKEFDSALSHEEALEVSDEIESFESQVRNDLAKNQSMERI